MKCTNSLQLSTAMEELTVQLLYQEAVNNTQKHLSQNATAAQKNTSHNQSYDTPINVNQSKEGAKMWPTTSG